MDGNSKGLTFENDKPVFFFRALWTTDGQVAYWLWRVYKGESTWAKALGQRLEGQSAVVYIDNPEKIHTKFIGKLIKMALVNHGVDVPDSGVKK